MTDHARRETALPDARLASEDAREQFARCIRDTAEPQAALPEPPVGPVMCPHGLYDWMCRKCKDASGGDPVEVHPSDSRAESQAGLNGPSGSPTSPPEPVPSAALPDPPEWAAALSYALSLEDAEERAEFGQVAVNRALGAFAEAQRWRDSWHDEARAAIATASDYERQRDEAKAALAEGESALARAEEREASLRDAARRYLKTGSMTAEMDLRAALGGASSGGSDA